MSAREGEKAYIFAYFIKTKIMKHMKKIVILAVVCLCFIFSGFTVPETENLRSGIREIRNVRDAEIVVLGDSAAVALKTAPLFTKSEYNALEAEITLYIRGNSEVISNIYFSYDLDIFLKTSALRKKIDETKDALGHKEEIFELIRTIERRKK